MKIVSVSALALFLCGCDYSIESRSSIIASTGCSEVYQIELDSRNRWIARDTNGAVWVFSMSRGSVESKAKIFDAPK